MQEDLLKHLELNQFQKLDLKNDITTFGDFCLKVEGLSRRLDTQYSNEEMVNKFEKASAELKYGDFSLSY